MKKIIMMAAVCLMAAMTFAVQCNVSTNKVATREQSYSSISKDELSRLEIAANGGDEEAQYKLGEHYWGKYTEMYKKDSYGSKKYLSEAYRWFRLAADKGNANASYRAGVCCGRLGVHEVCIRDARLWRAAAIDHYRDAARHGHLEAKETLSRMSIKEKQQ